MAIHIYEPIRKATRYIPHKILYRLCYLPAAIIEIFNILYKAGNSLSLTKNFAKLIPFKYYSDYPFRVKLNDSFDVFATPSFKYYTEQEIRDWFEAAGLKDIKVLHRKLDGVEKGIKGFGIG